MNEAFITDRNAIVTYKNERVGLLTEAADGTRFAYDARCRRSIACTLPVEVRDHFWQGGLHPFFQHLLAEGWLRGVQARAGRSSLDDDFAFLLTYGADCIGAVGVEPLEGADRVELLRPTDDPLAETAVRGRRTLSGVHKKLLACRDADGFRPAVEPDDAATFIAKYNRDDIPTLVWNEDISLRLARELLGSNAVTQASIASVAGIEGQALLVERFDRRGQERLRLEDFAQILNRPRGPNMEGKYQGAYEEIGAAIAKHSARPRIDLDRFFRLLLFNTLIGNADAHLKNFSLLESPDGLRLSPAYDLVASGIYAGQFDSDTALAIGGRKRALDTVDRSLLLNFAEDIGLPRGAAPVAIDEIARRLKRSRTLAVPRHVAQGDFRQRYLDIVLAQSARLFV